MYINTIEAKKIEELKKKLMCNVKHIHDFDDVDNLLYSLDFQYVRMYLIFDNTSLKNYFLENLKEKNVINCNSSYDRFVQDMNSYDKHTFFYNINNCKDYNILMIVYNTNNIMIH